MSLAKEIEELQRKAGSYELLSEEYTRLKESVREALIKLRAVLEESGDVKTEGKYRSFKDLTNHLYEKMRTEDNFQVTREVIEKLAPSFGLECTHHYDAGNVLKALRHKPNIEAVMDGNKLRLFFRPKKEEPEVKIGNVSFMG